MTSERDTAVVARLRAKVKVLPRYYGPYSEIEAVKLADVLALLSSPPPSPEPQTFDVQEFERLRCDCTSPDFHQTGDAACAISRLLDEMRARADHAE